MGMRTKEWKWDHFCSPSLPGLHLRNGYIGFCEFYLFYKCYSLEIQIPREKSFEEGTKQGFHLT